MADMNWTLANDNILKTMLAYGCTYSEIAERLQTTRSTIAGRAFRIKNAGKPYVVAKPRVFKGKRLAQIKPSQCLFAVTPHKARTHKFCGDACQGSYCEYHCTLVYVRKYVRIEDRG